MNTEIKNTHIDVITNSTYGSSNLDIDQDFDRLPDADWSFDMSPEELIDAMFECTDKDGIYYGFAPFNDFTYDIESGVYQLCWTEKDRDHIKDEFNKLYASIHKSASSDTVEPDLEPLLAPFKPDLGFLSTLRIIKEADLCNRSLCIETMNEIISRVELEEARSDTDILAYYEFIDALSRESDSIIGDGLYSYELIQTVRRLYELIKLDAPEILINNDANNLAQCLVYHKFGVLKYTMKKINLDYPDGNFSRVGDDECFD